MQTLTIEVGTVDEAGVISVYQPLKDVIRALLLRWIRECERGETAARAMAVGRMREVMDGQMTYWRHAISCLSQRLMREMGGTIRLRDELSIIAGLTEDQPVPERWMPHVEYAESMGDTDGTVGTAGGGSGGVRVSESGGATGESGGTGAVPDATDHRRRGRRVQPKDKPAQPDGAGRDGADRAKHASGSKGGKKAGQRSATRRRAKSAAG